MEDELLKQLEGWRVNNPVNNYFVGWNACLEFLIDKCKDGQLTTRCSRPANVQLNEPDEVPEQFINVE